MGKKALEDQMERGVNRRFVQLLVDKHDKETDPWPQGGEILFRLGHFLSADEVILFIGLP